MKALPVVGVTHIRLKFLEQTSGVLLNMLESAVFEDGNSAYTCDAAKQYGCKESWSCRFRMQACGTDWSTPAVTVVPGSTASEMAPASHISRLLPSRRPCIFETLLHKSVYNAATPLCYLIHITNHTSERVCTLTDGKRTWTAVAVQ